MLNIPLSYSYRNLWNRRLTTLLTILGIALVVFVFTAVLMLAAGLKKTLVTTGGDDNLVVFRQASQSDTLSVVDRDSMRLISTFPEVALNSEGKPMISGEMVTIINLYRYGTNELGNVIVRGTSPFGIPLRPQIHITEGRDIRVGTAEVIVGRLLSERFQRCKVGQTLEFGSRTWNVVGIFDAEKSGFDSEIWADVELMLAAFNRPVFSTVTFRLKDPMSLDAFNVRMKAESRLKFYETKSERKWYGEQSEGTSKFLKVLGLVITIIFSFGAMIGATITMYASVANRTVEIGTLRALGFSRRDVSSAFLVEALFISIIGGIIGLFLASFLQTLTITSLNFTTFSTLAFGFDLNTWIGLESLEFAIFMGILGGFLPALRAARLNIVAALRGDV